jgi:hypothetical protein
MGVDISTRHEFLTHDLHLPNYLPRTILILDTDILVVRFHDRIPFLVCFPTIGKFAVQNFYQALELISIS